MFRNFFYKILGAEYDRKSPHNKIREENPPCIPRPVRKCQEALSVQIYRPKRGIVYSGPYGYTIYKTIDNTLSYTVKTITRYQVIYFICKSLGAIQRAPQGKN